MGAKRLAVCGLGWVCVCASVGGPALGGVHVNEVLGSTAAKDAEFIELHNTGLEAVDLSGWSIELWDSDEGATFGTRDADSPMKLGGTIDGGGYFLLANTRFSACWEVEPELRFRDDGIENSSYTLVLRDGFGEIVETIFVSDGGAGDRANIGGRAITPDALIESDGRHIPAGFARVGTVDGSRAYRLLEFSPVPMPGATPGMPNVVVEDDGDADEESGKTDGP